jgi:galactosamine-6-phosphate isomerase
MEVKQSDNYELLSKAASDIIFTELQGKPDMLLCTSSGKSPSGTYRLLAEKSRENPQQFNRIRILKLDEWGGIAMDNPQSCEVYLQVNIVRPLRVSSDRYMAFDTNPERPEEECIRMAAWLTHNGPIDICVLGLGLNGHIAFNEPGDHLQPHCHMTALSEKSMQHPMAIRMGEIPTYGLTLGMADILQSKKIIMLVTGVGKQAIIQKLLSGKVTTQLPASFLWLHHDTICLVDKSAI